MAEKAKSSEGTERKTEVWADLTAKAKTLCGEEFEYPTKLSLGKELRLREALADELSSFQDLFSGDEEKLEKEAFSFFFKDFPKLLPKVVSVIVDKSEDWVNDELDIDTAEVIAGPFLNRFFESKILKGLSEGANSIQSPTSLPSAP